jgi:NADH:ubiquinone oxidoreductase subunit F (NADH-binding)
MRAIGSGLGASIIAIASNRTLASVAIEVASFFARESCGKCPVCVRATQRMADAWPTAGEPASAAELYAYAHRHRHKGICSFLDTASWMTESFLARLMPEVATAKEPSAR